MKKNLLTTALSSLLLAGSMTLGAAASPDTEKLHDIVDTKVHSITEILNDTTIDKPQKDVKIMDIADEMIDFEIMARLSLGKHWNELTPAQQKEFISLYVTRVKDSYLEKLYLYNGQKVRIDPAQQTKSTRIEVPSYIIDDDGETEILYKFYRNKKTGEWSIYDINVAGVSIVQAKRSEFAEFLKSATVNDLIDKLRKEQKQL